MPILESQEDLVVVGQACPLLDDPEKSIEIDDGHALVTWGGDESLLIDRYDCRAHLTDLNEFESPISLEPEDYLSEDELTLEKMCEFERYLELRVDVDEVATQAEEEKKRGSEKTRSQYGAVGFSYDQDNGTDNNAQEETTVGEADRQPSSPEAPYVCPPDLVIPEGVELPETEKQAQIIERTAVFVARQGNQMEIILKAKQTNNPLFSFLNYDHQLNQFYKEVVKLIRSGRYIPKARPVKVEPEVETKLEPNKSIHEDVYELKLPKVDISNTAYASLINKFKKVNEAALAAANASCRDSPTPESESLQPEKSASPLELPDSTKVEPESSKANPDDNVQISISKPPILNTTNSSGNSNGGTSTASSVLTEEYEQCYQEYYKHYYAHYYTQFSEQQAKASGRPCSSFDEEQRSAIVQQAAKAAAVAASAAVNAMYQAGIKRKSQTEATEASAMTASERGIIDKMAEYVIRNGPEFEELVTSQKAGDPRFGFLKSTHPLHEYYQSRKKAAAAQNSESKPDVRKTECAASLPEMDRPREPLNAHKSRRPQPDHNSPEKDLPKERQSSISFRLSRPSSSNKIRSTTPDRVMSQTACGTNPVQQTDVHAAASYPTLCKQDRRSRSPQTPANSMISTEDGRNGRSPSPVKFSLPGIPFASDTSSAESSPRCDTHSSPSSLRKSRSRSRSPIAPASSFPSSIASGSPIRLTHKNSPRTAVSTKISKEKTDIPFKDHRSPKSRRRSVTRSPVTRENKQNSPPDSWGSSAIEEMLGLVDGPSKERSPDPSSIHHAAQKVLDERIREERRKRAAQLVARLKSSTSDPNNRQNAPPPPPPDSVPAAVAHAVVASLKRRQEEKEASAEAEAKARKRTRSPPAAYALPKERSQKSSKHSRRSRQSPSPDSFSRVRDSSRERSYSKHSKYRKSKH